MTDPLDAIAEDARRLLKVLRRSIRSSVAITRRRLKGSRWGFEAHVASFGETFDWRHEDLGWELGRLRVEAKAELAAQLLREADSFSTNAHALLTVSEHINAESSGAWRLTDASKNKLDAMCELHSQALGAMEDILALILAGSPTGALARWRTIYELSTIALFIARAPNETAERYLCSQYFELRKETRLRLETDKKMRKRVRLSMEAALLELEDECARVIKRHGEAIARPYGWAAKRIGRERVVFRDLEERVQPKSRRIRYLEATNHVHGQRLSSMRTLSRGREAASLFVGKPLALMHIENDVVWAIQEMNQALAGLIYRRQGVAEAIYWSYAAHMLALDAATDAWHGSHIVDTGYLRTRFSISTTPTA